MSVPFTRIGSLYIGSRWVKPASGEADPVINPATEEVIGHAPVGGVAEADAAVAAARRAFDEGTWPRLTFKERATVLRRMHQILTNRLPEIRALITAEAGATYGVNYLTQTATPLRHLLYAVDLADRIVPETLPVEISPNLYQPGGPDAIGSGVVVKEPVGVVAGVTGYNFPFLLNLAKIVPALLAGNTIVLKPSPFTPFAALLFGEVADELGLPAGVLNVVTGGIEVAKRLTSHPDVDLVSFTGSDAVGARIMEQAAPTLKRVVMELGGKSALIVRHDADIQGAALAAVVGFTGHTGQGCAALTRYIVHNSVRPAFVAAVQAIAGQLKLGDPSDQTVVVGPLIRESQRAKVEHYVRLGHESGARLVFGGKRPDHLRRGYFYAPTLFDDVDNASAIAQDEIFGPVGVTIGFDTDDEAVRLANQSKYGLAGAIMSADRATAYRMGLQCRTGFIWLNGGHGGDMSSHAPFGGYRRSGIGHEYGKAWLDEYLHQKVLSFPVL